MRSINRFQKLQPILLHQLIKTWLLDVVNMIEKLEDVQCWSKEYEHLPLHYFHVCDLHIQMSIYMHIYIYIYILQYCSCLVWASSKQPPRRWCVGAVTCIRNVPRGRRTRHRPTAATNCAVQRAFTCRGSSHAKEERAAAGFHSEILNRWQIQQPAVRHDVGHSVAS